MRGLQPSDAFLGATFQHSCSCALLPLSALSLSLSNAHGHPQPYHYMFSPKHFGPAFSYTWPEDINENEACAFCYTSGTTGPPKGVAYSHRSQFVMTLAMQAQDL